MSTQQAKGARSECIQCLLVNKSTLPCHPPHCSLTSTAQISNENKYEYQLNQHAVRL